MGTLGVVFSRRASPLAENRSKVGVKKQIFGSKTLVNLLAWANADSGPERECMASILVNAEELKYWRLKRVMSRTELVEKAGIGKSTYNNLESGWRRKTTPETVHAIAAALRISPERLVIVDRSSGGTREGAA